MPDLGQANPVSHAGATAGPESGGRPQGLWWLSPAGALTLIIPGTLLLTARLNDLDFRLFFREPRSVPDSALLLMGAAALVLAAVAATTAATPARPGPLLVGEQGIRPQHRTACTILFWLTLIGYGAFFGSAAARGVTPAEIVDVFVHQDNYTTGFKAKFTGVVGITTLTQCGVAFLVVAVYLLMRERNRRVLTQVVVVLLLTLLRSFLNSERLAMIEVAVPLVTIVAMAARRGRRTAPRVAARLAPLVLAPLLFLVFALFEYSRSWQFFKSRTDQPFAVFALVRLIGYYATSYNNGYVELMHDTYPGRLPRDSLSALWNAPGVSALDLYAKLSAPAPVTSQHILERFANPEFNNLGGLTTPFVDFGLVGGFLFFAALGVGLGLLYRGFREGTVTGALLYPVAMTGLLDLPRYLYFSQGRVVPAVVSLAVLAVVIGRTAPTHISHPSPGHAVRGPIVSARSTGWETG